MKTIPMILACVPLFLAGCTLLHHQQRPMPEVLADYHSISRGMSRDDVLSRLGAPDTQDRAGNLHWKQEWYAGDSADRYAELTVNFDTAGLVRATRVNSGTVNFPSIPDNLVNLPQAMPVAPDSIPPIHP
ncbi:MAG TPA: outer membrane protein assembly factor BamE [Opitutaceae bacterium]|nr:outer membrane protein assembly factor BamE [Opitutaceae bacterium]